MKFGVVQLDKFNAIDGSYSIVTAREVYDSQITATDAETLLLKTYFESHGEVIYRGNVMSNRAASAKEFRLYPSGKKIKLNLVYPKLLKSELRLYLSGKAGFMPAKGDVWFLFVSKLNELWIGAMPENEWRAKNSDYRNDSDIIGAVSIGEDNYLGSEGGFSTVAKRQRNYSRNLIDKRLKLSKYKCEFDPLHKLFIARATGCPYLEVHHIIPRRFQLHYKTKNLDSLDNLCCLCPYCHSAVHHANEELVREILTRLADRRSISLHYKVSNTDLFRLYSVEAITRE